MKKIAIPVMNDKLSRHFGHCEKFYFYEIENTKVVNKIQAIRHFNQHKINVFVGSPEKSPSELVESHLNGSLKLTGNYCDH